MVLTSLSEYHEEEGVSSKFEESAAAEPLSKASSLVGAASGVPRLLHKLAD